MNFWNKVKEAFGFYDKTNQDSKVAVSSYQATNDSGAWRNLSRRYVLTHNEYVFSIITRLSNVLASLPIHEYQDKQLADGESLADMLRTSPNPNMTGYDFIVRMETDRNTYGNAYAWIQRSVTNGSPVALWPLDPNTVSIWRNNDDNTYWYFVNSEEYQFRLPITDVIHVKHIMPTDTWYGTSPIDVLNKSLDFQQTVEEFSENEMSKKDKFVLQYDRSIDREKRQAMINDFVRMVNENGGAIVQEAGWTIDRYESKFNPTDLSSVEQISRIRIATAFNVPISFLNDDTQKATTNVEHVNTQFVQMTLLPIVKQYESQFNSKLLAVSQRLRGFYFKFNVNGLLRGDMAARTQFYQTMVRNGSYTPNDVRKLEDMTPSEDEAADKLYISKDLYPLEEYYKEIESNLASMETGVASAASPVPKKGGEQADETS